MIKYFIYCRKSTEEEERQILSIEAQHQELRDYAKQNNLFVVREFTESKSAKEPGREIFNSMITEIEKGSANGILAWNPDRLARNSVDGGRIIYLVDTGKIESLKFPTFWFEPTPQGKFMLSVAFGQAKYYTDNLRENILRGMRQKLRRGEYPHKAPHGYLNEPRLRTIEPNPATFQKVKTIFEMFATGNYSLSLIRSKMFSLGLAGRHENIQSLTTVHRMLSNPFYYGIFKHNNEYFHGTHKPMISKKLFDKVQIVLKDKSKPRKKREEKTIHFLNFAKCGECGYSITAERKFKESGREYVYYRCTKKSKIKKCTQSRFLREKDMETQVKDYAQKVSLPELWEKKFLEKIKEWGKEENQNLGVFAQNLRIELLKVKTKIDRLTDLYLNNDLEIVEYKEIKNKLTEKKVELEQKITDFEQTGNHRLELVKTWVLTASQTRKYLFSNNFLEIKNILKKIGSNRTLMNQKLNIEFQKPWNLLCKINSQARAESEGDISKNLRNCEWWT